MQVVRCSQLEWKTAKNNHRFMDVVENWQIELGMTCLGVFKTKQKANLFIDTYLCSIRSVMLSGQQKN
jgi:hypothetical protein